jgi:elongation factor P
MIKATDLKNGIAFLHYDKPFQVIKYSLIKMGRGSAYVKISARNLETGSVTEVSYQSNASVEKANTVKKQLQYLYQDAVNAVFMDPATYEQTEISLKLLGNQANFLNEGNMVSVLFWSSGKGQDQALSVELPAKVVMTIAQTDPGVRGNSATNLYKPAVLANGLKTKVPLFIKVGDKVRIDTRTGEYLERAK